MAYSPHGKIVLRGEFGISGSPAYEEWSASMSYDVVGPDVGAMPSTLDEATLVDIAEAWSLVIEATDTAEFSQLTRLTEICYYRAQSDGTSSTGTWQRYYLPTLINGDEGTTRNPLQIATVVSLDAGGARGGRFGRFYLPALAAPVGTDSRWTTTQAGDLLGNVVTALTAVNLALTTEVGSDVELVVASGRGDGENRPVRNVRVGRVPDTMRSRRNALVEDYQVQAFQTIP